jgi:hypothetical protein
MEAVVMAAEPIMIRRLMAFWLRGGMTPKGAPEGYLQLGPSSIRTTGRLLVLVFVLVVAVEQLVNRLFDCLDRA